MSIGSLRGYPYSIGLHYKRVEIVLQGFYKELRRYDTVLWGFQDVIHKAQGV